MTEQAKPEGQLKLLMPHFGLWARMSALSMRIEAIAPVSWSASALEAFEQAKARPDSVDAVRSAVSHAEAEWAASGARERLAEEVSRLAALATPGLSGSYDLHSPLAGTVLRAPDSLSGTPFEMSVAPVREAQWRFGPEGDPDIKSWTSGSRSGMKQEPFAASAARQGGLLAFKASRVVDEQLSRLMGPAREALGAAAQVALERQRAEAGNPTIPRDWTDYDVPKHVQHLARLRAVAAMLPENVDGALELEMAVGKAAGQSLPKGTLGWMWGMAPETGVSWDNGRAKQLSRAAERAWGRLKSRAVDSRRGDYTAIPGQGAQMACDLALVGVWAWAGGAPDRESRLALIATAARDQGHWESDRLNSAFGREYGRALYAEFAPEPIAAGLRYGKICEAMGWEGQPNVEKRLQMLATHEGRPSNIWNKVAADAARAARDVAAKREKEKLKAHGERPEAEWAEKAAQFMSSESSSTLNLALAIAEAREARWAKDHGMAQAAARIEDGAGAKVTLAELDAECARRQLARASTPTAKLWAGLEAAATKDDMRGEAAKARARKFLASVGFGERKLAAFAQTPQCAAFLEMSRLALEAEDLEARKRAQARDELAAQAKRGSKKSEFAYGQSNAGRSSDELLYAISMSLMAYARDAENPDPEGLYLDAGEGAKTVAEALRRCATASRVTGEALAPFARAKTWISSESGSVFGLSTGFDRGAHMAKAASKIAGGKQEAYAWLGERSKQVAKQAGIVCKHAMDHAMGRKGAEAAPVSEFFGKLDSSLMSADKLLANKTLPYGWESEQALARESDTGLPEGVDKGLDGFGFAGRMAKLASKAGRAPQWREGVDERSMINGWLAEGKKAGRDWLGLSEGAWKIAAGSDVADCGPILALASKRAEAELIARHDPQVALPGWKERNLDEAEKFSDWRKNNAYARESDEHAWLDESYATGAAQSKMLMAAAARGLGAQAAHMAVSAAKAWDSKIYAADSAEYEKACLAPVSMGMSASEALSGAALELKRAQAKRARFELAILERAGALWAKAESDMAMERLEKPEADHAARLAQAKKSAKEALCSEVKDLGDWANDMSGRFWGALPEKFGWSDLARGSRQWHDAQVLKEAASGQAWEPLGLEWKNAPEGWDCIELTTPTDLALEGKAMHHCVGGYASTCQSGKSRIFSIQKDGARVSTLELSPPAGSVGEGGVLTPVEGAWRESQHKAVSNQRPSAEACEVAQAYLKELDAMWSAKAKAAAEKKAKADAAAGKRAKELAESMGGQDLFESEGFDALGTAKALEAKRREASAAKQASSVQGSVPNKPSRRGA